MPRRAALARCISILGHPLLVLPLALLMRQSNRATPSQLALLGCSLLASAVLVIAFMQRQVRRGRWAHVDASGVDERRRLNRFLLMALVIGTALAGVTGAGHGVVAILGLAAAIVAAAMLTTRYCKLSLHVAFAVFAALLLARSGWPATAAMCTFAAVVAWSRLVLACHVPRDVIAGALVGLVAGAGFLVPAPTWQA